MEMPMTRLTARSFAILACLLPGAAAFADTLQDELRVCRSLTDDDARLICYDAAVDRSRNTGYSRPAPAAAPAPAQPAAAAASTAAATGAAAELSQEVISIPVHPQLSQEDLEKIVGEVNAL